MKPRNTEKVKIETYKGVDIFYNKNTSSLEFGFEGRLYERIKYLFEAKEIIDEPRWEKCDLEGYFVDGTFNDFIGFAKAEKKDIKSGIPYWKLKGKYDLDYKSPANWQDRVTVYPKNSVNDNVYLEWKKQDEVVSNEERKRIFIIKTLSK